MALLETIKGELLQARKDRDKLKSALLSSLVGAAEKQSKDKAQGGKPLTDRQVSQILQTFKNGMQETLSLKPDSSETQREIEIVDSLMPVAKPQLSEEDLRALISALAEHDNASIGSIMHILKASYEGQYDPRQASSLVKESLK